MADDESDGLPPEQIQQIGQHVFELLQPSLQALLKNSARSPAPGPPSVELDTLKAALIREVKDLTKNFVPSKDINERIDHRYAELEVKAERQRSEMLKEMREYLDEAREKARTEFYDLAEDLGIPVRTVKERSDTRDNIKGTLALHTGSKEFKTELWKGFQQSAVGWITAAFFAFLAFLGFKGGGSSH